MDDNFIFEDKDSKGIWKKVLVVFAVILGILALLVVLIWTSIIDEGGRCKEIASQAGIEIDRCENKFKQIIFVIGDTANTRKPVIGEENGEIISLLYDAESSGARGLSYISVSKPDDAPQPFGTDKKF